MEKPSNCCRLIHDDWMSAKCRAAKRVVRFYNQRGTAEQWIKKGKNAVEWTSVSCHDFVGNQVWLHLFALAYNLENFPRQALLPQTSAETQMGSSELDTSDFASQGAASCVFCGSCAYRYVLRRCAG
jgi:hypothetical protein